MDDRLRTQAVALLIDDTSSLSVRAQRELLMGERLHDEAAAAVADVQRRRRQHSSRAIKAADHQLRVAMSRPPEKPDWSLRPAVIQLTHGKQPRDLATTPARRLAITAAELSRTEQIDLLTVLDAIPARSLPLWELLMARYATTPAARIDDRDLLRIARRMEPADRLLALSPLLVPGAPSPRRLDRRSDELLAFWAQGPGRQGPPAPRDEREGLTVIPSEHRSGASPPVERRQAWPLLTAPDAVSPDVPFTVRFGLSSTPTEGVGGTGQFDVPNAPFLLHMEIVAHGFTLHGPAIHEVQITDDAPYPTLDISMSAKADQDLKRVRELGCIFVVDGTMHGYASRLVEVVPTTEEPEGIEPLPGGPPELGLEPASLAEAPDLTIVITHCADTGGTMLEWRLYSPHLTPPTGIEARDIGTKPEDYVKRIIDMGNVGANDPQGLFAHLIGSGQRLAEHMPADVRATIAEVTACVAGSTPAVLIATQDPYLPWELAVLDPDLQFEHPAEPPFLGARMAIGRWPLTGRTPPPKPPTAVQVKDRAVVSGTYLNVQGIQRLESAEAEATDLLHAWAGAQQIEPVLPVVLDLLRGAPAADLLHFALHGQFSESIRNGLVLIKAGPKGQLMPYYLQPEQVESGRLARAPFVFLNACQVAAGTQVLGNYAGLASAFLKIGAASVVAPLWSIDDTVAHTLALDFYTQALDVPAGEERPVADILREGRARFTPERVDADDAMGASTHLAFQFFGHPRLILHATT